MHLDWIELRNFRNFEHTAVQFSPNVNVLLGSNGQGKTNLIEALYLLGRGTSFRAAINASLIRHEAATLPTQIKTQIHKDQCDFQAQLTIGAMRKDYLLNGKRTTAAVLDTHFPLVLFSPESLSVIKDGPEQRRLFLDEMLAALAPRNARVINEFKKLLRTRNRVLKDHLKGLLERRECLLLLESLQDNYLEAAAALTLARIEALARIQPNFQEAMQFISNSQARVGIEYLVSDLVATGWDALKVKEALRRRLSELQNQELASGVSLVGPHKHDIRVLFDGKDSRFYCSQGQQRALILSFKMARIVYHYQVHKFYPFLLLDDVLSELDIEKRANLVVFLRNIRSQIFITTTDFSLPLELGEGSCTVFNVERGSIR